MDVIIAKTNAESKAAKTISRAEQRAQNEQELLSLVCGAPPGWEDTVKRLIDDNTDVNCQDDFGQTPLLLACYRDNVSVMKALLLSGARHTYTTRRTRKRKHETEIVQETICALQACTAASAKAVKGVVAQVEAHKMEVVRNMIQLFPRGVRRVVIDYVF